MINNCAPVYKHPKLAVLLSTHDSDPSLQQVVPSCCARYEREILCSLQHSIATVYLWTCSHARLPHHRCLDNGAAESSPLEALTRALLRGTTHPYSSIAAPCYEIQRSAFHVVLAYPWVDGALAAYLTGDQANSNRATPYTLAAANTRRKTACCTSDLLRTQPYPNPCWHTTYHGDPPSEREVLCGPLEDVPARQDRHEYIADPGVHWAALRPVERVLRNLQSSSRKHRRHQYCVVSTEPASLHTWLVGTLQHWRLHVLPYNTSPKPKIFMRPQGSQEQFNPSITQDPSYTHHHDHD